MPTLKLTVPQMSSCLVPNLSATRPANNPRKVGHKENSPPTTPTAIGEAPNCRASSAKTTRLAN